MTLVNPYAPFQRVPDSLPQFQALIPPAPVQRERHNDHRVALAAAIVTGLLLARHHLKQKDAPKPGNARQQALQAWVMARPSFMGLATPAANALYRRLSKSVSEGHQAAASLGNYLATTSADALQEGYDRQLAGGWHPDVAWHRSVEGYGLDDKAMRAYIDRLLAEKAPKQLVPPTAKKAVHRAIIARADVLAGTELQVPVAKAYDPQQPRDERGRWSSWKPFGRLSLVEQQEANRHHAQMVKDQQAAPTSTPHDYLYQTRKEPTQALRMEPKPAGYGRFAVTGGRDYMNVDVVRAALDKVDPKMVLVHGNARGTDQLAAGLWEGQAEHYPADWDRYGRAAGPIRNREMVESGLDFVIRFPGGRGTADMSLQAKRAGVRVVDHDKMDKLSKATDVSDEPREPKGSPHGGRWTRVAHAEPETEGDTRWGNKPGTDQRWAGQADTRWAADTRWQTDTRWETQADTRWETRAEPKTQAEIRAAARGDTRWATRAKAAAAVEQQMTILAPPLIYTPVKADEKLGVGYTRFYIPMQYMKEYRHKPPTKRAGVDFDSIRDARQKEDPEDREPPPIHSYAGESPFDRSLMGVPMAVDAGEWKEIMNQAEPLWHYAYKHADKMLTTGQGKPTSDLYDWEIERIGKRAGVPSSWDAEEIRYRIAMPIEQGSDQLRQAFADYAVWNHPDILPDLAEIPGYHYTGEIAPSGAELAQLLNLAKDFSDEKSLGIAIESKPIPMMMTFGAGGLHSEPSDMRGRYAVQGTEYTSAINQFGKNVPPGYVGVLEYHMDPIREGYVSPSGYVD